MGVVDLLPRCLSSVYLFWEPDLGPLSLGKLTSLREIEFVRAAAAAARPSLRYYYLGFYIHDCHRMRYKADFGPSQLLCPAHGRWAPAAGAAAALGAGGRPPELCGAAAGREGGAPPSVFVAPTSAEVDAQRLFIPAAGGGGGRRGGRRGQVVTFGQLRAVGVLSAEVEAQLGERLRAWQERVGPAVARATLYQL